MLQWQFWKSGKRELTPELKKALLSEFHLDEEAAGKLHFVQKRGKFAGRSVTHICIFDAIAVPNSDSSSITYDEVVSVPEGALFTVYIEKDGVIYLASKRRAA